MVIDWINGVANALGGLFMRPFEGRSAWPGLLAASVLVALMALAAFRFCSNQAALRRRREVAFARLLELQLFRDDLLGIFGTLGRVVCAAALYLKESLKPLGVVFVPLALALVQFAGWFEFRPLIPGEAALVTLTLDETAEVAGAAVKATASSGIDVETEPFLSPAHREAIWRVRPRLPVAPGRITVNLEHEALGKEIVAAENGLVRVSLRRVREGAWIRLLHPGEPALPRRTPAVALAVDYPRRKLYLGSYRVHWLVALCVCSLLFGLALKRPLRVEF